MPKPPGNDRRLFLGNRTFVQEFAEALTHDRRMAQTRVGAMLETFLIVPFVQLHERLAFQPPPRRSKLCDGDSAKHWRALPGTAFSPLTMPRSIGQLRPMSVASGCTRIARQSGPESVFAKVGHAILADEYDEVDAAVGTRRSVGRKRMRIGEVAVVWPRTRQPAMSFLSAASRSASQALS